MYESPITIIESTLDSISKAIIKQRDDAIFAEIQSAFGVDMDREELIRALQYDRDQYGKGYADGKRDAQDELVRCRDCNMLCKSCTIAQHCSLSGIPVDDDDFCSFGERKDNGN